MDLYVGIVTTATGVPLLCVADGFVARFVEHGVWYHYHSLDGEQYLRRDGEDPVIRDPETRAPRTGHLSTGYRTPLYRVHGALMIRRDLQ